MKYTKLTFGLTIIAVLISCESNERNESNVLSPKTYEIEEFSSNLESPVNSVYFIDENNGFAVGYGDILKTTDGGITWISDSITDLPLNSIFFVDNTTGYAVGGKSNCGGTGCTVPGSVVYKTSDSGDSWEKLDIPYERSQLYSVTFVNDNIGFAVGLGLKIKTIDGGQTWDQFVFDYPGSMKKVLFTNPQTGFCAGLNGNIYKTSDQGNNWIKSNNESDGNIYDFCFVDESVGYAGGSKEIVKTTDGGETWTVLSGSPSEIYFIHFSEISTGIAIGYGHYTGGDFGTWTTAMYTTNDGGETWKMSDNIEFGYSTVFIDSNLGYSIMPNKTFKIIYR